MTAGKYVALLLLSMSAVLANVAGAEPYPCCRPDIEERLQDLEAIRALGGAPVSFKIGGQVNRAALIWDDGVATDAFVVDNIYSSTRAVMTAKRRVGTSGEALAHVEIEYRDAGSSTVSQFNDEGSDEANETRASIRLRQAFWSLSGEGLGRLSVGHLAPITNSLVYYKLWDLIVHTSPDAFYNTAFAIRNGAGALTGLKWGTIASALDTPRGDFIKYETPSLAGFALAADWGENDVYDIALTLDREIGGFKVAAALGYFSDSDALDASDLRGSLLLVHKESGLYAHLGGVRREFDAEGRKDASAYYVHVGLRTRIIDTGATLIYGEYGRYRDLFAGGGVRPPEGLAAAGLDGAADDHIAATDVTRYGLGVMQSFDAAALELYALASHFEADVDIADTAGPQTGRADPELKPWSSLVIGSRLKF